MLIVKKQGDTPINTEAARQSKTNGYLHKRTIHLLWVIGEIRPACLFYAINVAKKDIETIKRHLFWYDTSLVVRSTASRLTRRNIMSTRALIWWRSHGPKTVRSSIVISSILSFCYRILGTVHAIHYYNYSAMYLCFKFAFPSPSLAGCTGLT